MTSPNPDITLPVVAYAAKSTADPRDSTGSQLERVREAVERAGSRVIVSEHAEAGRSGFKGNRGPALAAAISSSAAAADEHGHAELWVFHSSRLGRGSGRRNEARAIGALFYQLRERNVTLRSVEDDAYLREEFIGMASSQANKYSADLAAHVRRGLDQAWEQGGRPGGPTPDGYVRIVQRDDRDQILSRSYKLDSERAPVIRRVFDLAEQGHAPAAIARLLNGEGLRTAHEAAWTRRRIQDTLKNQWYCGQVTRYRGTARELSQPGDHPALISLAEFHTIQTAFQRRDKAAKGRPKVGRPTKRYALGKLARCGRCGGTAYCVTSPYKRKDGSRRRSYVCGQVHFSTGLCDAPPVSAELVDDALVRDLPALINVRRWADDVVRDRQDQRAPLEVQVAQDVQEVGRLDREVVRAEDRLLADGLGSNLRESYEAALVRKRQERGRAEVRAQAAGEALAALDDAPRPVDGLRALAERLTAAVRDGGADMAALNMQLRAVMSHVELDTTADGIEIVPFLGAWAAEDTQLLIDLNALTRRASASLEALDSSLVATMDSGQIDVALDRVADLDRALERAQNALNPGMESDAQL